MSRKLVVMLLASCATTSTTPTKSGPRELRASEHLDAARDHDEVARQLTLYPDRRPDASGAAPLMRWTRTWDSAADHDRLAKVHRSAAAQLQAEYDEACAARSPETASISPLHRYAIGGNPIDDGAVIYLSSDVGSPDQLLLDMRCHRAWMMLGRSDMDSCPLDLAGIQVTATGDAKEVAVTIRIRDRALVGELQRRAAVEVESAAQRRSH